MRPCGADISLSVVEDYGQKVITYFNRPTKACVLTLDQIDSSVSCIITDQAVKFLPRRAPCPHFEQVANGVGGNLIIHIPRLVVNLNLC